MPIDPSSIQLGSIEDRLKGEDLSPVVQPKTGLDLPTPSLEGVNLDLVTPSSPQTQPLGGGSKSLGTEIKDEEGNITQSAAIMRCIVGNVDTYRGQRSVIFSNMQADAFRDEAHILFKVFYKYRDLPSTLDEEFLRIYLTNNMMDILQANRRFIDLNQYAELAAAVDANMVVGDITDKVLLYVGGVLKYYNSLLNLNEEPPTLEETHLLMEKYKQDFSNEAMSELLEKSLTIVNAGLQEGKNFLFGYEAAQDYVLRGSAAINGVMDTNNGKGYVNYLDALEDVTHEADVIKISDFGEIGPLNRHFGGIYTQQLITVAAPMKGGKTKFCTKTCYQALTEFGQNVTIWPIEGSIQEMVAELQAIHFNETYNKGMNPENSKLNVTKDVILKDKWDEIGHPEWKEQCETLALELGTNPKYGKLQFIDQPPFVETFIDVIDTSVKSNGSTMVFVDYLMMLKSKDNRLRKHEIIQKAYPEALNYVKRNNITLISPAQYNQEAIRAMSEKSEAGGDGSDELRTAVGGSVEIVRSSDITIALWASTDDLSNNSMKIMSIPSRVNKPFDTFEVKTDLGSCTFMAK